MALIPPKDAIYPKSRIKNVTVLYDGTVTGLEFSIAELELKDGSKCIGIRHDRNEWNENDDEKGYPVVRGGLPSWFILPDISKMLPIMNLVFKDKQ